jgi:signal transduction histidine kinase
MADAAKYIRSAPVAMALVEGAKARISIVNDAFAKVVDSGVEALVGQALPELFIDRNAVATRLSSIRDGEEDAAALPVTRTDGVSVLLTAWPIERETEGAGGAWAVGVLLTTDSDGRAGNGGDDPRTAFERTLRDVNEALLLTALREQADAEEARSESEAKSVFLASVSHELRTPLNSIIGYADLLQAGVPQALPGPLETHVERIRNAGEHLLSLIEQIIEASRAEFDDRVDAESFDVAEFVPEVLDLVRSRAKHGGLELQMHRSTEHLEVISDRRKIRQILLNLLVNAIKFTETGSVRLELDHDESTFTLRVIDTGVGIEEEARAHIFRRFWQAGGTAVRTQGGMGIGLWVVRTLVDAMGGDVEVESTVGEGTTFQVTLPRSPGGAADPPA